MKNEEEIRKKIESFKALIEHERSPKWRETYGHRIRILRWVLDE